MSTKPTSDELNQWINFVLYAVTGCTGQADDLMRRHRRGIQRVARWMGERAPFEPKLLHRGLLLEPQSVRGGDWTPDGQTTFFSYSEDRDVACWFARPDSIISGDVVELRPGVVGYLTSRRAPLSRVLWHHAWQKIPVSPSADLDLRVAASVHPDIEQRQFAWNLQTQREVLLVSDQPPKAVAVERVDTECPDTEELDARFTFPDFLRNRYGV